MTKVTDTEASKQLYSKTQSFWGSIRYLLWLWSLLNQDSLLSYSLYKFTVQSANQYTMEPLLVFNDDSEVICI